MMIHTACVLERAGLALGHVARGNASALVRLEATIAQGKRTEYMARRDGLRIMALSWGIERLHAQVLWAEAEGKRDAKALLDAALDTTQKVANLQLAQSRRNAATAIADELQGAASRLVGLELALSDLAKSFHFDARAVRDMTGVDQFRPAEIEVDPDAVAETRQRLTTQLIEILHATENMTC